MCYYYKLKKRYTIRNINEKKAAYQNVKFEYSLLLKKETIKCSSKINTLILGGRETAYVSLNFTLQKRAD